MSAAVCALLPLVTFAALCSPLAPPPAAPPLAATSRVSERGCLFEGQWHADGARLVSRAACLECACSRGALACSRPACAPLPDPPPRRCHVLHRRHPACCPEIHCPDGVVIPEQGESTRIESEDQPRVASSAAVSLTHACVEGGTVYSAGSAMEPAVACEHCFCLQGRRRCVRPRCLPPPPGCGARPPPGACCPQRYYCDRRATTDTPDPSPRDCVVEGVVFAEGERVGAREAQGACTQCFCLRGQVTCQALGCAPTLLGCAPLRRPGDCCAHQYNCDRTHALHVIGSKETGVTEILPSSHDVMETPAVGVHPSHRSVHSLARGGVIQQHPHATTRQVMTAPTSEPSATDLATQHLDFTKQRVGLNIIKVKRKASESSGSHMPSTNFTSTASTEMSRQGATSLYAAPSTESLNITSEEDASTSESTDDTEGASTEQPDASIKITINGTINCTTEFTSKSVPLDTVTDDEKDIHIDDTPSTPNIERVGVEANTFNPIDIITDSNRHGNLDENDTFTINVTSSLLANNSESSSAAATVRPVESVAATATDPKHAINNHTTSEDYDYEYAEPTLPPSLPNLKIIPFVAADAVVNEDDKITEKDIPTYPVLEREDKFPVYYEKLASPYPSPSQEFSSAHRLPAALTPTEHSQQDNHSINLFSPPVETEGGFIPKGPGIMGEYYAPFTSTPVAPGTHHPHLNTLMRLNTDKANETSLAGTMITTESSLTLSIENIDYTVTQTDIPALLHSISNTDEMSLIVVNNSRRPDSKESSTQRETLSTVSEDVAPIVVSATQQPFQTMNTTVATQEAFETMNATAATHDPFNVNQENNDYHEYEEEDEEDEEFSFGSVLKLLLSDHFESTKPSPVVTVSSKNKSTAASTPAPTTPTPALTTPMLLTMKNAPKTSVAPFSPLPPYKRIYSPYKNMFAPASVHRIDHLVLGEATAIKRATTSPASIMEPSTTVAMPSAEPSLGTAMNDPSLGTAMNDPSLGTAMNEPSLGTAMNEPSLGTAMNDPSLGTAMNDPSLGTAMNDPSLGTAMNEPSLGTAMNEPSLGTAMNDPSLGTAMNDPSLGTAMNEPLGAVGGLLRVAGCNIYGRMYRVGRIIAELSSACQECRCTELGVHCTRLAC